MEVLLGQMLIETGILTEDQVQRVLDEQKQTGEPFGLLSEQLCGVEPAAIEEAWARQYARITRTIDPEVEVFEDRAKDLITRRQAWQFRVLPLRFDGGQLIIATTQEHLRRALRFAVGVVGVPVFFVMAESEALGKALCRHYPWPGMTPQSVDDDGIDRLVTQANGAQKRKVISDQ